MATADLHRLHTLQHITRKAYRLLDITGGESAKFESSESSPSSSYVASVKYSLPDPLPITSYLIAQGLQPAPSEQLSQAYLHHARGLKGASERKMQASAYSWLRGCHDPGQDVQKQLSSLYAAYYRYYTSTLQRWVDVLIQQFQRKLCAVKSRIPGSSASRSCERRPFIQEAIPTLEQAFQSNPYPSRQDKERLAEKTGMHFEQIHVWFQNRRNRVKKEGRDLRKTTIFHPMWQEASCVVSLFDDGRVTAGITEYDRDISIVLPDKHAAAVLRPSPAHLLNPLDRLELERPAHAYPAPFPPICHYDPFPLDETRSFQVPWLRSTSLQHGTRMSDATVDSLIQSFGKLSLDDDGLVDCKTNKFHPALTHDSCGLESKPLDAPLAALVRHSPVLANFQPILHACGLSPTHSSSLPSFGSPSLLQAPFRTSHGHSITGRKRLDILHHASSHTLRDEAHPYAVSHRSRTLTSRLRCNGPVLPKIIAAATIDQLPTNASAYSRAIPSDHSIPNAT
uniref:A2 mating-type protein n=1 Tax=Phanerodontia chrysosporium TaxID=2822231 RepID=E7DAG7_PHACH|nr:A2 mating-type protein [Phanerodontia chrysosporium]